MSFWHKGERNEGGGIGWVGECLFEDYLGVPKRNAVNVVVNAFLMLSCVRSYIPHIRKRAYRSQCLSRSQCQLSTRKIHLVNKRCKHLCV